MVREKTGRDTYGRRVVREVEVKWTIQEARDTGEPESAKFMPSPPDWAQMSATAPRWLRLARLQRQLSPDRPP